MNTNTWLCSPLTPDLCRPLQHTGLRSVVLQRQKQSRHEEKKNTVLILTFKTCRPTTFECDAWEYFSLLFPLVLPPGWNSPVGPCSNIHQLLYHLFLTRVYFLLSAADCTLKAVPHEACNMKNVCVFSLLVCSRCWVVYIILGSE